MGFKNSIAPRSKTEKKKSPWDFRCPEYDERTSCYVDAGSHYGVGFNNPVGHSDGAQSRVPTMPFGRSQTLEVDEAPRTMLSQEYVK